MGVCSVLQLQASRGQGVPEPARIAPRAAGDSKSMDSSAGSSSEPPSWRPAAAAGGEQCKAAAATHLKYRIDQQQQRQRRVLRSNGRWPVPKSGEMCQSIGQGGWPAISVVAASFFLHCLQFVAGAQQVVPHLRIFHSRPPPPSPLHSPPCRRRLAPDKLSTK